MITIGFWGENVWSKPQMSQITVIYDGDCVLCKNSINWLSKSLTLTAIPFQSGDLASFGLTKAECEKQVYAISNNNKYGGVSAVIFYLISEEIKSVALFLDYLGQLAHLAIKRLPQIENHWLLNYWLDLLQRLLSRL